MRLEYLTYIKMIAKTNSLTAAANACYISHQALSKAIKMFEDEIGAKLLVRTNQGVKLTEEGEYVLSIANQILPLINEMENHFSYSETSKLTGKLNILSISVTKNMLLKKSISTFYKYYPNIQLTVKIGEEKDIISALLNKEIDLGFFNIVSINNKPLTEIPDELEFVPFLKCKFIALVNKQSPLAKLDCISLSQLLEYPVILMPSTELGDFNPYKILSHFGTVKVYLVDSYDLYEQFLIDDLGVTLQLDTPILQNKYISTSSSTHIIQRPIAENVYCTMGYIYNKNHNDNPYIKQFLDIFNKT